MRPDVIEISSHLQARFPVKTSPDSSVALPSAPVGGVFRVNCVDADGADADRLRSLGVCLGRRLSLVQAGDPLIVCVVGSRVGISARLAQCVMVELECLPEEAVA